MEHGKNLKKRGIVLSEADPGRLICQTKHACLSSRSSRKTFKPPPLKHGTCLVCLDQFVPDAAAPDEAILYFSQDELVTRNCLLAC